MLRYFEWSPPTRVYSGVSLFQSHIISVLWFVKCNSDDDTPYVVQNDIKDVIAKSPVFLKNFLVV